MKSPSLMIGGAVIAGCLGLSACGGGGVSSTPTPTPAPVPTPTPTYTPVAQIAGDHAYDTVGTTFVLTPFGLESQAALDFSTGANIEYTASNDLYTLTLPNGTRIGYGPSQIVSTDPTTGMVHYRLDVSENVFDSDFYRFIPRVNGVALSYTLMGSWNFDHGWQIYHLIGGVPTIASDMPKTGSATYATAVVNGAAYQGLDGPYYLVDGGSTATFSANFVSGTVSTTLNLKGSPYLSSAVKDFGMLSGSGTISSSGPDFSGTINSSNGTGAFSGAFFGPKAIEMGYSWYYGGSDFNAAGMVAGKKN